MDLRRLESSRPGRCATLVMNSLLVIVVTPLICKEKSAWRDKPAAVNT